MTGGYIKTKFCMNYLMLPHFGPGQTYCQKDCAVPAFHPHWDMKNTRVSFSVRILCSVFLLSFPAKDCVKDCVVVVWNQGGIWDLVFSPGWAGSAVLCLFKRKHRLSNLLSKIGCCGSLLAWKGTICLNSASGEEGRGCGMALGSHSAAWRRNAS